MRWRTANKRKRRNFWKRRGHTHIRFNKGSWTWLGLHDHFMKGFIAHIPYSREQPRAYRYYL